MKLTIDPYDQDIPNKCAKPETKTCCLSFWRLIAIALALVIGLCVIFMCKVYIKFVLLWLEHQDPIVISVTISILFVLVSLPISIGYIVLVVAEGYLFGVIRGIVLTIIGANLGLFVAHMLLKAVGHHQSLFKYTQNDTAQAIMRVISGPLCFKIVFCSRLTPIPFGLQNTIFALSNVNTRVYHFASFLGLMPAQFVGVYLGSTLRSMQDVLEDRPISSTTYLLIAAQLALAVCLMIWFSAKARIELMKVLAEAEGSAAKVAMYNTV